MNPPEKVIKILIASLLFTTGIFKLQAETLSTNFFEYHRYKFNIDNQYVIKNPHGYSANFSYNFFHNFYVRGELVKLKQTNIPVPPPPPFFIVDGFPFQINTKQSLWGIGYQEKFLNNFAVYGQYNWVKNKNRAFANEFKLKGHRTEVGLRASLFEDFEAKIALSQQKFEGNKKTDTMLYSLGWQFYKDFFVVAEYKDAESNRSVTKFGVRYQF